MFSQTMKVKKILIFLVLLLLVPFLGISQTGAGQNGDVIYQDWEEGDVWYGWSWADGHSLSLSAQGEPVKEGWHSFKVVFPHYKSDGIKNTFGGVGLKAKGAGAWNLDLKPAINDRLTFWFYGEPMDGFDMNMGIEFFDKGAYNGSPAQFWTGETAKYGEWTQMTIPFSALPADLDLTRIEKIQMVFYWPGTFYIDDMRATSSNAPELERFELGDTELGWKAVKGAEKYLVEKSITGEEGDWTAVYEGKALSYTITALNKTFFRVSSIIGGIQSKVSPVKEFSPNMVVIDSKALADKKVIWSELNGADRYEVQKAYKEQGPWLTVYEGTYPGSPLRASGNVYYRVRGMNANEKSPWSPALLNARNYRKSNFVKTDGRILRKGYGEGEQVTLRGVNLGSWLLLETWMSSMGGADNPVLGDDYSVRQELTSRFGAEGKAEILDTFQRSWIKEQDLDIIKDMGMNVLRLPVSYLNVMNEDGTWKRDKDGNVDFGWLDWVVEKAADRGMYVLLDLHAAPGSQSREFHSGRKDYNKLFEDSPEGEAYRKQTREFWRIVARHYKDNPTVVGYDPLNEPTGPFPTDRDWVAADYKKLWDLFDELYDVIREEDKDHVVFFNFVWHWVDSPNPVDYGWQNVVYQFHYYGPGGNEDANFEKQKEYIDRVIANEKEFAHYNVPMLVGEFAPMSKYESWEYLFKEYTRANWNWIMWSYKTTSQSSTWGLFNGYQGTDGSNPQNPRLRVDSFEVLKTKVSRYDTRNDFHPNRRLLALTKAALKAERNAGEYIEAEKYSESRDGFSEDGCLILTPGAGAVYRGFNFDLEYPLDILEAGMTAENILEGQALEFRLGSPAGELMAVFFPDAEKPGEYQWKLAEISSITGIHDLYVQLTGEKGVVCLDYFQFKSSTRPLELDTIIEAEELTDCRNVTVRKCCITGLDEGDWVGYKNFNFGHSRYNVHTLKMKLAAGNNAAGKEIEVRLDSETGRIIGTLTTQKSGGNVKIQETRLEGEGITGLHDLYFTFKGKIEAGIDWFELVSSPKIYKIDGTDIDAARTTQNLSGYFENGDWLLYKNVDIKRNTFYFQTYLEVEEAGAGGEIEVRLGSETGPVLGTVDLEETGPGTYGLFETELLTALDDPAIDGVHDVYLVFYGTRSRVKIDWIKFTNLTGE